MHVLGKKILIKPQFTADVTAGGIALPDTAKQRLPQGTVIAIGDEILATERAIPLNEGDTVLFNAYGGATVSFGGDELVVIDVADILVVFPKEETNATKS